MKSFAEWKWEGKQCIAGNGFGNNRCLWEQYGKGNESQNLAWERAEMGPAARKSYTIFWRCC